MTSAKKVLGIAKSIRQKAAHLKQHKDQQAEKILQAADNQLNTIGLGLNVARAVFGFYAASHAAATTVLSAPSIRGKAQTFASNCLNDIATRLNDVADIVEYVASTPEFAAAANNLVEAFENVQREVEKAEPGLRSFRVVQDDESDEDDDETNH